MIISASRRTDIPAIYSEWFLNRLREGYLICRNPMNGVPYRIDLSPGIVDCIVFWTKNPVPLIPHLSELADHNFYFQFTLTGYGKDIERNLPDKKDILIPAFRELSDLIGAEKVIWRYDPILISDRYTPEYHRKAFAQIASSLRGYTEKCVISFIDIYPGIRKALQERGVRDLTQEQMRDMAVHLRDIASENGMALATCAEITALDDLGISHNSCIDRELIERITGKKIKKTKKITRDSGQRKACACMSSRDIGTGGTCSNGCIYCYANRGGIGIKRNIEKYDPSSPILCGSIAPGEEVKDASDMRSLFTGDGQISLFD